MVSLLFQTKNKIPSGLVNLSLAVNSFDRNIFLKLCNQSKGYSYVIDP